MKSETLVWVMEGVDYFETLTRQERRGTSHCLSIRVTRGVYHRSGTFRSRAVEWEETVHSDSGLLGFTTKHLYFSGAKKKFRVRYDKIVDLSPSVTASASCRTPRRRGPRRSGPGTGDSPTA